MLEYCHKKQAKLAAYRALVATILTKTLWLIKDEHVQLRMAHQLMDLLYEDLKKIQDPEFKMNEVIVDMQRVFKCQRSTDRICNCVQKYFSCNTVLPLPYSSVKKLQIKTAFTVSTNIV